MACPTCDHTMQSVGFAEGRHHYWCPRCGTLRSTAPGGFDADEAPKLVGRCREFEKDYVVPCGSGMTEREWIASGIRESINKPEDRPQ